MLSKKLRRSFSAILSETRLLWLEIGLLEVGIIVNVWSNVAVISYDV
jgi:hypothetical protein